MAGPVNLLPDAYKKAAHTFKAGEHDFEGLVPQPDGSSKALFGVYSERNGTIVREQELWDSKRVEEMRRTERLNPNKSVADFNNRQYDVAINRLESAALNAVFDRAFPTNGKAFQSAATNTGTDGARKFIGLYNVTGEGPVEGPAAIFSVTHRNANGTYGHMNVAMDQAAMENYMMTFKTKIDMGKALTAGDHHNSNVTLQGMRTLAENERTQCPLPNVSNDDLQNIKPPNDLANVVKGLKPEPSAVPVPGFKPLG